MKVEIFSDVVCPWCYIGHARFAKAAERFRGKGGSIEVTMRPFQLDPDAPAKGEPLIPSMERKFGPNARQMIDRVVGTAAEEGLELDYDRALNATTLAAHRLIEVAGRQGLGEEMAGRLFRAYFAEGRDVSDAGVLAELAAEVGVTDTGEGTEEVREQLGQGPLARHQRGAALPVRGQVRRLGRAAGRHLRRRDRRGGRAHRPDADHPARRPGRGVRRRRRLRGLSGSGATGGWENRRVSRRRLGYLLKHANLRLSELVGAALAPYGIDGREFAVLALLDSPVPMSQLDAARRLGIDRTTMVAMVDALERKDLVRHAAASRRPAQERGRADRARAPDPGRGQDRRGRGGGGVPVRIVRRRRRAPQRRPGAPGPASSGLSAPSPSWPAPVVAAAQHLIAHVRGGGVADHHLLAGARHRPAHDPGVELAGPPAPAQHLDLQPAHLVGQLEQPLRRREHHRPEVRGQPEGVDVHAVTVHQVGQLLDLLDGVEAGLVADEVVDAVVRGHQPDQVHGVLDLDGLKPEPYPAGHLGAARAVVLGQHQAAFGPAVRGCSSSGAQGWTSRSPWGRSRTSVRHPWLQRARQTRQTVQSRAASLVAWLVP